MKACEKLTVLCHIAASLINVGNNDFNIISRCGVLGATGCIRHVGSTLWCAFNREEHPVFS